MSKDFNKVGSLQVAKSIVATDFSFVGWEDCLAFYFGSTTGELAGSELGFVGQWKRLRTEAHRKEKGDSNMVWEFEHGFEQAVGRFRGVVT